MQQVKIYRKNRPETRSIAIIFKVMKQIGEGLCNLPEDDGDKYLIV